MNAGFNGYGYSAIIGKTAVDFFSISAWAYGFVTEGSYNLTVGATNDFELKHVDNTVEFYVNNVKVLVWSMTSVAFQNGNIELQILPGAGDTGSTLDVKWLRVYTDKIIQR
jgi:hypothetical protein